MFFIYLLYYLPIKAARPHEGFPINHFISLTHLLFYKIKWSLKIRVKSDKSERNIVKYKLFTR